MKMKKITLLMMIVMILALAFTGCGGDADNGSDAPEEQAPVAAPGLLPDAYDAAYKAVFGEEGPGLSMVEDDAVAQDVYGLSADMMKDYIIALPMMNVHVDTFIGVEANEDKVSDVEAALNAYKDQVIADREAFPYLPDHLPKAQEAQVLTVDNYVFYISMAMVDEMAEDLNAEVKADVEAAVAAVKTALGK